jgi:hypothetical protein
VEFYNLPNSKYFCTPLKMTLSLLMIAFYFKSMGHLSLFFFFSSCFLAWDYSCSLPWIFSLMLFFGMDIFSLFFSFLA